MRYFVIDIPSGADVAGGLTIAARVVLALRPAALSRLAGWPLGGFPFSLLLLPSALVPWSPTSRLVWGWFAAILVSS